MSAYLTGLFLLLYIGLPAQTITHQLTTAFSRFEKDPQLEAAIASLYVVEKGGTVVFQKNASIGLAPASTQKVITSATAYEVLGKSFRYKTAFGLMPNSSGRSLYIDATGDPTFGSWRWPNTKDAFILNKIAQSATNLNVNDTIFLFTNNRDVENIPNGWIWEDIGNYYGAGAGAFNWRENQFDLYLRSGNAIGDPVVITGTNPQLYQYNLTSRVTAAVKGSGDNAYIYFPVTSDSGIIRGTIPVNENRFVISGALPQPAQQFAASLLQKLHKNSFSGSSIRIVVSNAVAQKEIPFYTHVSPPLDSLIYWLNKKSINLYAEALLKTFGHYKNGIGSSEEGLSVLKTFWKTQGIPEASLNLVDGSGLSPLNRVTTKAQAVVLQYAVTQPWFPGFYNSLPEYNNMKLKSGTINGVKGFAGYHTSRSGKTYIISFLVNNYSGSSADVVKKMYAVLDVLK